MKNKQLLDPKVVDDVPEVTPEQVVGLLNKVTLIDVRRPEEFIGELGHIRGAKLVTLGPDLDSFLNQHDKDDEIVFICRSGARSGRATLQARASGFSKVVNLQGGMLQWRNVMTQIKEFFDKNTWTLTYVVWDESTRDAVVIDPVLDYDQASSKTNEESAKAVIGFLRSKELNLHYILETHAHADHLSGSQILKREFPKARVAIGEKITKVQEVFKGVFGLPADFKTDGSQFDRLLKDGEQIDAGSLKIKTIFTPGHTPACASYLIDGNVFVGDALFMPDYGTGRCDFPSGSAEDLYHSVHERLYALPDQTKVYTGHDYMPNGRDLKFMATLADEKRGNIQLKTETTQEEFVRFRKERDRTLAAPKLLLPSIQVNIDAGHLPEAEGSGKRYLKIPIS